jgi:hypothetical protein
MSTPHPSSAQRRRRAARLAAPIIGMLAAGLLVWQGSTAAFTAQTTNTADAWATGNLSLVNDGGTGGGTYAASTTALFNETLIKPGVTGAKCINVRSNGNLPGTLKLFRGALTGTNAANLANNLVITVDAVAPSATAPTIPANCAGYGGGTAGVVFNGTLTAFPTTYAGAASSGALTGATTQYVTYRIGWTMPATVTDNTLQSSSVLTDLTWEVQ